MADKKTANVRIVNMRLQDIAKMNTLFIQSMRADYRYFPPEFRNKLIRDHSVLRLIRAYLSPKSNIILVSVNGVVRGYCVIRLERTEPATLLWLYVDTASRGLGVGKKLVLDAVQRAKSHGSPAMQLVTHDRDDFFMNAGFSRVRRVSGMLAGVDMSIMRVELS